MRKLITFIIILILIGTTGYRIYGDLTYISYERLPFDYSEMVIIDDEIHKEDNLIILNWQYFINWKLVKDTIDEDLFYDVE